MLAYSAFAQSPARFTGDWVGILSEANLPLIFHIAEDSSSGLQVTLDSPLQGASGIKCTAKTTAEDSLIIEAPGASYRGRYRSAPDSLYGVWRQGPRPLSISFKRMLRPQTPRPPFNYKIDLVEYDNADKTVHLGATLTRPLPNKRYPVAILITGSGLQDRDETIAGHKPFAIIADYLTRQGMAVLRVDDRNMGKSTGEVKKATSADFANDVIAGINYLRTRKDIDTNRIGLIGHSEGGLIAPIVYSHWPRLDFIVMLAGQGVPGWEIILRQQTDPIRPISMPAFNAYLPLVKEKLDILNATFGAPDSITLRQIKASYTQWKSTVPDSLLNILHARNVTPEMYAYQVSFEMNPWFRYFYKTDPAAFLQQVKCPVLALNGEKDIQVFPEQNIPAIKTALNKGGNTRVTTHIFPGLNHLFQHCQTCQVSEYPALDESFAPEVLTLMGDWIKKICNL
jgi:pimeloyl-ACP methyl ester carboxylesterase